MEKKIKVLVTGGAGFIGSHLVDELVAKGYKVLAIDDLSSGVLKNVNKKAEFVKMDVRSPKLTNIFAQFKPDYVFHTAAQIDVRASIADPMFDANVNIIGSLNVIKNAADFGVKKFIFSSSGGGICTDVKSLPAVEGRVEYPNNAYGVAKLSIEKYLHYFSEKFGLPYVALRYANVYGPRQNPGGEAGIISILSCVILSGEHPVIHGNGLQTRDFVFVDDVVAANMLAMKPKAKGVYNVGSGKETTINEIFKHIAHELFYEEKPAYDRKADSGVKRSLLKCTKIKRELGWEPKVPLETGLKKATHWFVEHHKEKICKDLICTFCYEGV